MYLELLEHNVKNGVIHLHMPSGKKYRFGRAGREAHWVVKSEEVIKKIARDWEFQLGETYVRGEWDVADCELQDLLFVLRENFSGYSVSRWLQPLVNAIHHWNKISRSYNNASYHYDLDADVFRLFLDDAMHYSCGYFSQVDCSLEQAQEAKCRHIANKLLLRPGQRVLDIGCGWGSLVFYLAEHFDVEVVGITLSESQLAVAKRRAVELGADNVRFELQDYREHQASYDRIVSIGMFEHVGKPFHNLYFQRIKEMLRKDGVALVHSIGRSDPPGATNPWMRKYIFPGGSIPALSEMCRSAEESKLMLTDVEVLRLHYAYTLREWFERFQTHRAQICARMGEPFCRMWEFYLAICEVAFQCSDLVVFQLQIAQQHHVVPPTRDYLYRGEEVLQTGLRSMDMPPADEIAQLLY